MGSQTAPEAIARFLMAPPPPQTDFSIAAVWLSQARVLERIDAGTSPGRFCIHSDSKNTQSIGLCPVFFDRLSQSVWKPVLGEW